MTTRSTEQGGVLPTAHRSSLTVLVLDDAPAGRELIERALGWVEAGLLSDFAWVTPGSIDRGGYGPVTVRAFMAARGPADPIDLLGLLSERDVRILRVVVVSLLSHADHDITRLAAACNDVSAAVERAMPIALSGRAPLHLVRINLLVPESDLEGVSPSCLQPRWDVNCVVSPEDRPDVDRMSVLVRSETNLVAHGLSAACNVGALWADMHMGPFDDIPASSNQHPDDVFVLRGQVRSIVGTNRALQLTAAAMTLVADEVDAVVEASPWGYPSTDPGRLVERASAAVLDQPDWSVVRPPDPPAESRDIGVGTLVRDWCLFQLKLPLFALGVVGRRVVVAVEDAVTDAVVGSGRGFSARFQPQTPDALVESGRRRLQALERAQRSRRASADAESGWTGASPQTWVDLRSLATSLVDGSEPPHWFQRASHQGLEEVLAPSYIVSRTVETADDTSVAQPENSPAQEEPPAGTPSEPSQEASAVTPLMARLVDRATRQTEAERLAAADARRVIDDAREVPDSSSLRMLRGLLTVMWGCAVVVGVLTTLWVLERTPTWLVVMEVTPAGQSALLLVVLSVAAVLILGHLYYRALYSFGHEVNRRAVALLHASDAYILHTHQEQRWRSMARGASDWEAILREVLHRPWKTVTPEVSKVVDIPALRLPAAVSLATPSTDELFDETLVRKAAGLVLRPGWASEEMDRLLHQALVSWGHTPTGDLPFDLDAGLSPTGPRVRLRVQAAEDERKVVAGATVAARVTSALEAQQLKLPDFEVRLPSNEESTSSEVFLVGAGTLVTPFVNEMFRSAAVVAGDNAPERSFMALPYGRSRDVPEIAERTDAAGDTRVRIDISKKLQASSLMLFSLDRPEPEPLASVSAALDDFN